MLLAIHLEEPCIVLTFVKMCSRLPYIMFEKVLWKGQAWRQSTVHKVSFNSSSDGSGGSSAA